MADHVFRLGDGHGLVEIRAADHASHGGYPATAHFRKGGLRGDWSLELVNVYGFIDELKAAHSVTSGRAVLSDDDGLQIIFNVERTGQVVAHIWINNSWNFGVEGLIEFDIVTDQTFLPQLWRDLQATFPSRSAVSDLPSAPRVAQ